MFSTQDAFFVLKIHLKFQSKSYLFKQRDQTFKSQKLLAYILPLIVKSVAEHENVRIANLRFYSILE